MCWFKIALSVVVIGVIFSISALVVESTASAGMTTNGSRWGRVDFTQYCGRTVGELLDILGNDFEGFHFDEESPGLLNRCTFTYNDGEIRISPATFTYCHRDRKEGLWTVEDFKKETIKHIQMEIWRPKDGSMPKPGIMIGQRKASGVDYLSHIGGTVDSLLKDIGYGCMASWADTGAGCYFGCWFMYPNDVTIQATLETFVPIPDTTTAINLINDYVLQQRIGILTIYFCERKGEQSRTSEKVTSPED